MTTKKAKFRCRGLLLLIVFSLFLPGVFAWWNESYNEMYNLTLVNNYSDDLTNYPVMVVLNTTGAECPDIRVIYNESVSIAWVNGTSCDTNATEIRFRANITALSNSTSYRVYFNPNASVPATISNMTDIIGIRGFGNLTELQFIWSFDNTNITNMTDISTGLTTNDVTNRSSPIKLINASCFSNACYDMNNSGLMKTASGIRFVPYPNAQTTLSCWVYPKSMTTINYIMGNDNAVSGRGQFKINTDGSLFWGLYDGSGDYPSRTTIPGLITAGAWYNVLARYNNTGDRWSIYVNGLSANGTTNEPTNAVDNGNAWLLGIGSYTYNANTYSNEIIDECAIWNTSIDDKQIKHYALYYDVGYASDYNELIPVIPTIPDIYDVPAYIKQNTTIAVNWTLSNYSNDYVNYNLTLFSYPGYSQIRSIMTENTTYNYNASDPLADYILGVYAVDSEDLVSNLSYTNSFKICANNFMCADYNICEITNITRCLSVVDYGCYENYTGNLSAYDIACIYEVEGEHPELTTLDLSNMGNIFLFGIFIFFWLGLGVLAFHFKSFLFGSVMFFIGVVLGFWSFSISWILSAMFLLFSALFMIKTASFK